MVTRWDRLINGMARSLWSTMSLTVRRDRDGGAIKMMRIGRRCASAFNGWSESFNAKIMLITSCPSVCIIRFGVKFLIHFVSDHVVKHPIKPLHVVLKFTVIHRHIILCPRIVSPYTCHWVTPIFQIFKFEMSYPTVFSLHLYFVDILNLCRARR